MFRKLMFVLVFGLVSGTGMARANGVDTELKHWGQDAKALATSPLGWERSDLFWFGTGIALTASSSLLDRRLYRQWNGAKGAASVGNAWAFAAPAGAVFYYGLQGWFADDEHAMQKAGTYAEAAAFSLIAAELLKVATGRERPIAPGTNNDKFHPGSLNDARTSFPSGHVALAFSVVGVLSAERDMPWWALPLAAVGGGLTMFARIRDKRHWASDTVAAALIGLGIGRFVGARRNGIGIQPMLTSDGVGVQWRARF